ncbi:hypothetical protein HDV05_000340 [Chytridiales sp. JEL 0842]|nr:hypothetical protein HDV05_000340 [Chytridiales sp. JEL 0842]
MPSSDPSPPPTTPTTTTSQPNFQPPPRTVSAKDSSLPITTRLRVLKYTYSNPYRAVVPSALRTVTDSDHAIPSPISASIYSDSEDEADEDDRKSNGSTSTFRMKSPVGGEEEDNDQVPPSSSESEDELGGKGEDRTFKMNQERDSPTYQMKRLVHMQNLLGAIYGSWAGLLPTAQEGADDRINNNDQFEQEDDSDGSSEDSEEEVDQEPHPPASIETKPQPGRKSPETPKDSTTDNKPFKSLPPVAPKRVQELRSKRPNSRSRKTSKKRMSGGSSSEGEMSSTSSDSGGEENELGDSGYSSSDEAKRRKGRKSPNPTAITSHEEDDDVPLASLSARKPSPPPKLLPAAPLVNLNDQPKKGALAKKTQEAPELRKKQSKQMLTGAERTVRKSASEATIKKQVSLSSLTAITNKLKNLIVKPSEKTKESPKPSPVSQFPQPASKSDKKPPLATPKLVRRRHSATQIQTHSDTVLTMVQPSGRVESTSSKLAHADNFKSPFVAHPKLPPRSSNTLGAESSSSSTFIHKPASDTSSKPKKVTVDISIQTDPVDDETFDWDLTTEEIPPPRPLRFLTAVPEPPVTIAQPTPLKRASSKRLSVTTSSGNSSTLPSGLPDEVSIRHLLSAPRRRSLDRIQTRSPTDVVNHVPENILLTPPAEISIPYDNGASYLNVGGLRRPSMPMLTESFFSADEIAEITSILQFSRVEPSLTDILSETEDEYPMMASLSPVPSPPPTPPPKTSSTPPPIVHSPSPLYAPQSSLPTTTPPQLPSPQPSIRPRRKTNSMPPLPHSLLPSSPIERTNSTPPVKRSATPPANYRPYIPSRASSKEWTPVPVSSITPPPLSTTTPPPTQIARTVTPTPSLTPPLQNPQIEALRALTPPPTPSNPGRVPKRMSSLELLSASHPSLVPPPQASTEIITPLARKKQSMSFSEAVLLSTLGPEHLGSIFPPKEEQVEQVKEKEVTLDDVFNLEWNINL